MEDFIFVIFGIGDYARKYSSSGYTAFQTPFLYWDIPFFKQFWMAKHAIQAQEDLF